MAKAIGHGGLQAVDELSKNLANFEGMVRRDVGTILLLLGKHTDADLEQPLLHRMDVLIENVDRLAQACQSHFVRELALKRSFWRRLKWLVAGS